MRGHNFIMCLYSRIFYFVLQTIFYKFFMVKSELLLRSNLNFSSSETTIYIASENPLIKVT